MGVAGLLAWLEETFPECFVHPDREVRHLLIDANSLVHDAMRRSQSTSSQYAVVVELLEQIIAHHRPTEGVVVALDGPAPFAKLDTQRSRRLKKALATPSTTTSGAKLSTSAVTPGTIFMSELDAELHGWAAARVHSGRSPCVITIDPSGSAGEVRTQQSHRPSCNRCDRSASYLASSHATYRALQGEVKLFLHLAREPASTLHGASHTVVGGDSDLVLLALASPARRLRITTSARPSRGGRGQPPAFCCERFRERLRRTRDTAHTAHTRDGDGAAAQKGTAEGIDHAALDSFVLLCLLTGNDYHKGLGCYRLPAAFEAWERVRIYTRAATRPGSGPPGPDSLPVIQLI